MDVSAASGGDMFLVRLMEANIGVSGVAQAKSSVNHISYSRKTCRERANKVVIRPYSHAMPYSIPTASAAKNVNPTGYWGETLGETEGVRTCKSDSYLTAEHKSKR